MNSKTKKTTPNLDLNNMNASVIILLIFNFILTIVPPIIGLLWFNNMKKTNVNVQILNGIMIILFSIFYLLYLIHLYLFYI